MVNNTGEQTKCCLRYLNWFWQVFGHICPNEWPFLSITSGFFAIVSQMSDFQGPATSRGEFFFFKVMGHMGTQKKRIWLTVSTQKTKIRYDHRVSRNKQKTKTAVGLVWHFSLFLVFYFVLSARRSDQILFFLRWDRETITLLLNIHMTDIFKKKFHLY